MADKGFDVRKNNTFLTMPTSEYSVVHPSAMQGAWTGSNFIYQRRQWLDIMNANGLADRQAILATALDQYADTRKIKDWDMAANGERQRSYELALAVLNLLWNLQTMANFRKVGTKYIAVNGSDTTATMPFTIDGWNTIIAELEQSQIPVPNAFVPLVKDLSPIMLLWGEYPVRSYPKVWYLPWVSALTLADVRTLRNTISSYLLGLNHWQKIGLPFHYFTRKDIAQSKTILNGAITDELCYWWCQSAMHWRDSGGTTRYLFPFGDFITNMTTSYSDRYYYWRSTPWHLHCMQQVLERYNAVNNPRGCLSFDTMSNNSKWGVYTYDQIGSARVEYADAANATLSISEMCPKAVLQNATYSPTNMTASNVRDALPRDPGIWTLPYSYAVLNDRPASYFTALMVAYGGLKQGVDNTGLLPHLTDGSTGAYVTSYQTGGDLNVKNNKQNKSKGPKKGKGKRKEEEQQEEQQ